MPIIGIADKATLDLVKEAADDLLLDVGSVGTSLGANTDSASASGSLHGKVAKNYEKMLEIKDATSLQKCVASNNIRASSMGNNGNSNNTTYTKVKEFLVKYDGVVRVSFAAGNPDDANGGKVKIYVNGSPRGIERSTTYPATVFTEDINVFANDKVQIYAKSNGTSSSYCYVTNTTIGFDTVVDNVGCERTLGNA